MSDAELEKALGQVKKEIKASRTQPEVPESTTTKETAIMATEKKTTKKSKAEKTETAQVVDGYTASQLAEELGMDSVTLRKGLRAIKAKKPGGRWVWPKKTDADLADIRKKLKEWNAEPKAKKEAPAKAEKKGKAPAKKVTKKATKKATKKVVKKKTEAAGDSE